MTRRYPAYRDSGVEWLGEVPAGWTILPVKAIASCNDEVLPDDTDPDWAMDYLEISGVDAVLGVVETSTVTFGEAASRARRRVKDGDVVLSTVRTYLRAIAQIRQPEENLIVSTGFAVLRPRTAYSGYLGYLLRSEFFISKVISRSVGVSYPAINASEVMRLPLPVPPLPEQTAIAAFLDQETAKIDALVAEQRRLIDLLREKRQAVISHAVTKGLNPNAPLKPSGVEWLGDVPEGWGFKRLSLVCSFEQGKAHEPYFDEDGDFICVTARFVSTSGKKFKRCSANLTPAAVGDILMVMSDLPNGRALARAFLVDRPNVYAVNQRVCRITTSRDGDARYFAYQLNRHTSLLSEDDGFNQTHLSNASFTKLMLVVPLADEQKRIADYLDAKTSPFDTLTATAEAAIALLQERRAALISAAVTGKIDVRDLAPHSTETSFEEVL